jgi:hypothetical protein
MLSSKTVIFIILSLYIVSCGLYQDENPCSKHLDRQTMVNIVTEVFLLESYVATHSSAASIRDSVPYYYAGIFQKYGTDARGFEDAFKCYLLDREQMNLLLDDVLSTLSIAQSKAQEFPESRKNESLDLPEEQN